LRSGTDVGDGVKLTITAPINPRCVHGVHVWACRPVEFFHTRVSKLFICGLHFMCRESMIPEIESKCLQKRDPNLEGEVKQKIVVRIIRVHVAMPK